MANNYCEMLISQDIKADCDNRVSKGVEHRGVIMNRADIDFDSLKRNAIRSNVIESLIMKKGKRGFEVVIPSTTAFSGTGTTLTEGVINTFTNTVGMIVLANDPDVTGEIMDGLANGSFVVIVENRFKNTNKTTNPGDGVFQIYGLSTGLRATELSHDKYSDDTSGGWNIVLAEEGAPTSGIFLYDTDLKTTRTIFESLTGSIQVDTISISPSFWNTVSAAGSKTFEVTSSGAWTTSILSGSTWISTSPNSGSASGTVTVTLTENTDTAGRTGTIRFANSLNSAVYTDLTVYQAKPV